MAYSIYYICSLRMAVKLKTTQEEILQWPWPGSDQEAQDRG